MPGDRVTRWDELRERAIAALREKGLSEADPAVHDLGELVQELQIYQAELELQNTDLQQTQLELEASRNRYRELFERAPVCYFRLDPDGIMLDVNLTSVSAVGAARAGLIGKPLTLYLMPSDHGAFYAHRRRVLELGKRDVCDLVFRRRDGSTFHGRMESVRLVADPNDPRPSLLSVVADVSGRRIAELELKSSEERYRGLFERSRDAIFVFDATDGEITDVNPAACALVGCSREQLIGRSRYGLFPPERAQACESIFAAHLRDPDGLPVELSVSHTDGSEVHVEASVSVVEAGGRTLLQATFRDITERKRAQEAQAQLEEQLRHAQKMEAIGRLAGAIAHDMNNVLGAIMGLAAVLNEELNEGHKHRHDIERHKRDAERIIAASRRGRQLTENLLGFSRKGDILRETLSLNRLAQEVTDLLARTTDRKVRFALDLDPSLPPVIGDPGQLTQVLMNLALNAIDAMLEGGDLEIVTRELVLDEGSAAAWRDLKCGRYVQLEVRDSGSGMSRETLERVFEPFFTTKPKGRGTGLGLAMVYGAIRNHGGAVSISSEPDRGTSVKLLLPVANVEPREPTPVRRTPTTSGARRKILVIDDEELFRDAARRQLELLGFDVIEAEDGPGGLSMLAQSAAGIALAVLDLNMPFMSGVQVLEQIRARYPGLPVLVCSGYSQERLPAGILGQGGVGFIRKPFEPVELVAEIQRLIGDPEAPTAT